MPRKTKKQKMASQLRRLRETTESDQPIKEDAPSGQVNLGTATYKVDLKPTPRAETSGSNRPAATQDYSFIYKDLKLIVALMIVTIVVELVLNLTLRTHFAKLLLSSLGIEI